jgi:hypothetical protein
MLDLLAKIDELEAKLNAKDAELEDRVNEHHQGNLDRIL